MPKHGSLALILIVIVLGVASCTEKPLTSSALDGADTLVSFADDVQPILNVRCLRCHGNPVVNSNYRVQSYQTVFGPGDQASNRGMLEVRPSQPDSSYLVWKLEGNPPWPIDGQRMPQGGPFLSVSQITVIRTWIRQGAHDN
jgi:hypothetical protein